MFGAAPPPAAGPAARCPAASQSHHAPQKKLACIAVQHLRKRQVCLGAALETSNRQRQRRVTGTLRSGRGSSVVAVRQTCFDWVRLHAAISSSQHEIRRHVLPAPPSFADDKAIAAKSPACRLCRQDLKPCALPYSTTTVSNQKRDPCKLYAAACIDDIFGRLRWVQLSCMRPLALRRLPMP